MDGWITLERAKDIKILELCMLASKVTYENEAYVKKAVEERWKENTTQAYIFCDQPKDDDLIVVAFLCPRLVHRFRCVLDFHGPNGESHCRLHESLGLQHDKDHKKGWPKNYHGNKPLAYYVLRDALKALLQQHRNAEIILTSHGAQLGRLRGIITFGQPRVGDDACASYVETRLSSRPIYRMVYRHDIVTRLQFHDLIPGSTHFGTCIYFHGQ
ncbi:hypothetical protein ACLOJK_000907 [Asimina triloba]